MEPLVSAGLSNALAATLLALPALLAGRFARRPALAHCLWLLVLLKLVTPPVIPVAVGALMGRHVATPREESGSVAPVMEEVWEEEGMEERLPAPVLESRERDSWRVILPALWIAGVVGWWGLAGWRIVRFRRSLRDATPAPEALREQARRLAERLGLRRLPGIWLVPGALPPMLWAVGAPRLLLPARLWERLDAEARQTLLIHELAHLRRRDHWVRLLELVISGLYWWHPVVWWARRGLREAEEQCCDAWVVWARPESAKVYAGALLEALDFLSESDPRPVAPVAASGIGHVSCLKRRLKMIVQARTPRGLSWFGRLAVLSLAAVLLPLAPTWAQREERPRDETTPRREDDSRPSTRREDPAPSDRDVPRRGVDKRKDARGAEERTVDPERQKQINEARADVEALAVKLREAQDRLAKLEGRERTDRRVATYAVHSEARPTLMIRREPPPVDQEERIKNLERQLERLMIDMKDLKRDGRADDPRPRGPDGRPIGPRTREGRTDQPSNLVPAVPEPEER